MKIGFLSDIHIDKISLGNFIELEEQLVEFINSKELEVLVVSGDLSDEWAYSLEICENIEIRTHTKVYFLPGNHDLWRADRKTLKAIEEMKKHPNALINQQISLKEGWALYGGLGWYDYSFRPEGVEYELAKNMKGSYWVDAKMVNLEQEDADFLKEQLEKWEHDFKEITEPNVIFAQHFVPRSEFLVSRPKAYIWNFCNAYMGSGLIGDFISNHPEIKFTSFGHSHKRFETTSFHGTEYICRPLGYKNEWNTDDFVAELEDCLVIKEI